MIRPPSRSLHPADASVIVTVRGVPSWGAILIALVFGTGGMLLVGKLGSSATGWAFSICFVVGVALAALAVRRGSIFTAMVQAPILYAIVVFGALRILTSKGTLYGLSEIVTGFPTMAVATGVALLLGLVRIIAQPVRTRHAPHDGGRAAMRA